MRWEKLDSAPAHFSVYRAKVPGGWLVTTNLHDSLGITFYPDANHEWDAKTRDAVYDER
jgi:hypothetical protein